MKYKNSLQGITQEQRIQINKLKGIIKNVTDVNVDTKSRKLEIVRARKIYFKVLTHKSKLSCTAMAKSVNQTHATVLHALRNFDFDYKTDKVLREIYDNVYDVFFEGKKLKTADDLIHDNLRLQQKIKDLNSEMQELRDELKQARSNNIRPRNQQTKIYGASEVVNAF